MKTEYSTYARRMEIRGILINQGTTTRRALAQIFSVSIVTIGQDIMALSRVAPICTEPGEYGGAYIIKEYRRNRAYLTRDEEELINELLLDLSGREKILLQTVLYKFKLPDKVM